MHSLSCPSILGGCLPDIVWRRADVQNRFGMYNSMYTMSLFLLARSAKSEASEAAGVGSTPCGCGHVVCEMVMPTCLWHLFLSFREDDIAGKSRLSSFTGTAELNGAKIHLNRSVDNCDVWGWCG